MDNCPHAPHRGGPPSVMQHVLVRGGSFGRRLARQPLAELLDLLLEPLVRDRQANLIVRRRPDRQLDEPTIPLETEMARLIDSEVQSLVLGAEELARLPVHLPLPQPDRNGLRHRALLAVVQSGYPPAHRHTASPVPREPQGCRAVCERYMRPAPRADKESRLMEFDE